MMYRDKPKMTITKLLALSKANTYKTHGSMGNKHGYYGLNREDIQYIFNNYSELDKYTGLQEKPIGYTMLRGDFDFESTNILEENEFDLQTISTKFSTIVQDFLNHNLIKTKETAKNVDNIVILTKPSYINQEKKIRKYGFHWCTPNVFLSEKDFAFFEDEMKKLKLDGFDPIFNKNWLMYNQHKNNFSGTYTIKHILNKDGKIITPEAYFKTYKFYDVVTEKRIKMTEPLEFYLHQILSILPFGRQCSDLKHREEIILRPKPEVVVEYITPDNIADLEHDTKALVSILSKDRSNDGKMWLKVGYTLFNISGGDQAFLKIWKKFSSVYPYYKEDELDKIWNKAQHKGIPFKKLHDWAKYDNYDAYSKITFKTDVPINQSLSQKDLFDTIKLDNIHPDETINLNNIGSYVPRLAKADQVFVRSNMMTFKTQNLKELLKIYPRILIASFRVSLINAYMTDFEDSNFILYSDCKGKIEGDRIICQIDSLYKVRGQFDLLILDEAVYTIDHLNSFVKKKREVWEALTQHIRETQKVIICDALLDNRTINIFKNVAPEKSTHIVENKWKSFDGRKINYIKYKNTPLLIEYILQQLEIHGSLFIPSNSKTLAEKIYLYAKKKGISIGIDTSENDPIPTSEWKNYKVFITTPTNVAGVSCNDSFGKTIAYGTSSSCSAQMFAQMLLRVRNTTCQEMDIIYKENSFGENYPTSTADVKQWINQKDDLIFSSGLKVDYIRDTIIEDDYYTQYIQYIKNQNKSKKWFVKILKGIFEAHGFESVNSDLFYPPTVSLEGKTLEELNQSLIDSKLEQKKYDIINTESKQIHEEFKEDIRCNVCKAKDLSEDDYKTIGEKYQKTPDEKLQLRKYYISKAYPNTSDGKSRVLTSSFIKTYEKIIPQYYNLINMNLDTDTLKLYIENEYNSYLKEHKGDENVDRLHEKNNLLKIWTTHNIITTLGFDSIWDTKEIQGFPYDKAVEFLSNHHHKISVLFGGNSKIDWKALDVEDKDDKKKITTAVNSTLKSVCNIGVRNKHKGGRLSKNEIYTIQGLDIWKKGDVPIAKNMKAEQLSRSTFYIRDDEGIRRRRTEDEQQEYYKTVNDNLKKHTRLIRTIKDQCSKESDEFFSLFEDLGKPILVN